MDDIKVEFTPEEAEQLAQAFHQAAQLLEELCNIIVDVVESVMEKVRQIAEQLARFFLKAQLLEWHLPVSIASFISSNVPFSWAAHLGWNWFYRRFSFIE